MALPAGFHRFKALVAVGLCLLVVGGMGARALLSDGGALLSDGGALLSDGGAEAWAPVRVLLAAVAAGLLGNWLAARMAVAAHPRGFPAVPMYLAGTLGYLVLTMIALRTELVGMPVAGLTADAFVGMLSSLSFQAGLGFCVGCVLLEARRAFARASMGTRPKRGS